MPENGTFLPNAIPSQVRKELKRSSTSYVPFANLVLLMMMAKLPKIPREKGEEMRTG